MKLSRAIKPVSYLKSNTAKVLRTIARDGRPVVITQRGEAKAVLQDIHEYEKTQESLAMLKVLAQGNQSLVQKRTQPARTVFGRIRARAKTNR